jgi:hypothetical protein
VKRYTSKMICWLKDSLQTSRWIEKHLYFSFFSYNFVFLFSEPSLWTPLRFKSELLNGIAAKTWKLKNTFLPFVCNSYFSSWSFYLLVNKPFPLFFTNWTQRFKLPKTVQFLAEIVKPLNSFCFVDIVKPTMSARCCGRWCYRL